MPKRPRYTPEHPEVGDIWQDCYDGRDELYLLLKRDENMDTGDRSRMYLTLDLQTGETVYRDLYDWVTDWWKRA